MASKLLVTLFVALNERWEPEAMGLFSALAEEEFLATLLLFRNIFDAIAPLNLALRKSHESLYLSDVKTSIISTENYFWKTGGCPKWEASKQGHEFF